MSKTNSQILHFRIRIIEFTEFDRIFCEEIEKKFLLNEKEFRICLYQNLLQT